MAILLVNDAPEVIETMNNSPCDLFDGWGDPSAYSAGRFGAVSGGA